MIHYIIKCSWSISKTKGHHDKLVKIVSTAEDWLAFITFYNANYVGSIS
jgi:hypothetical protein